MKTSFFKLDCHSCPEKFIVRNIPTMKIFRMNARNVLYDEYNKEMIYLFFITKFLLNFILVRILQVGLKKWLLRPLRPDELVVKIITITYIIKR